ncbi:hypothetical protein HNV10_16555 [Winogradskyella litoriviva]|uniref:Uncharacterized protein n=1 Tax=Winogradskyella litoriviva TaxID=1220182 RepID=A0ABX2E9L9_9FLAO|nr:hypothetical protein [Winogradskyella litoriviva]NRD24867.1 hypothetical protein [Winogradskyella litoriviva]
MRKTIIILLVFISWTTFSQSEKSPDRILTYGLPNFDYQKAMEFVGKKWGIELYPVAGCMVSQELMDSVKIVNKKLWKKMDSIHGMDSEKKFLKETVAEMKRINEAQKIFDSDRQIKKRIRKIKKEKKGTNTYLESVSADGNIYYWTVYSFKSKNNPEYNWGPEFKVGVNLTEKKTEIIELE